MSRNENVFMALQGYQTVALQEAIDRAARDGVRLVLAPGLHITGGLRLRSGLDLHLSEGAVLQFLPDYAAYADNTIDVIAEDSNTAMILVQDAVDVHISGKGVIKAPGPDYVVGRLDDMGTHIPAAHRPRVLVFDRCRNVSLSDFSVQSSPMWTIHLISTHDVTISGVRVDNDREMPNTDGMVIDSCERVAICDCDIATADDGVVLKTSRGSDGKAVGSCRDITVRDSRIESRSCALKIGTESYGDFENILFEDCEIVRSNRALGIFSRDGGRVRNIVHRNIRLEASETPDGFWGSGEAITINVLDRRPGTPAGSVEDIVFENITGTMEGAINIVADSASGIRNVSFRKLVIDQRDGRFRGQRYDMRPTHFDLAPSPDAAGRANAFVKDENGQVIGLVPYPGGMPAFFASNVVGLQLSDVEFRRPSPLPSGWGEEAIVVREREPSAWS